MLVIVFEVEMVVVRAVVIGAQHRAETLARGAVDRLEEVVNARVGRVPALLDGDSPPELQYERRDVDRIGDGMARQFLDAGHADDVAAGIAAHALYPHQLAAEDLKG